MNELGSMMEQRKQLAEAADSERKECDWRTGGALVLAEPEWGLERALVLVLERLEDSTCSLAQWWEQSSTTPLIQQRV